MEYKYENIIENIFYRKKRGFKMKKLTKIFSVFITAFLLTTVVALTSSAEKASAVATAPGVTYFKITGFANKGFYDKNNGCLPIKYASQVTVAGPQVYFSYDQIGYGNVRYSVDGGSYQYGNTIKTKPYSKMDQYGRYTVYAWSNVESLYLSPGTHTIKATCFKVGEGGSNITDTVTVKVS